MKDLVAGLVRVGLWLRSVLKTTGQFTAASFYQNKNFSCQLTVLRLLSVISRWKLYHPDSIASGSLSFALFTDSWLSHSVLSWHNLALTSMGSMGSTGSMGRSSGVMSPLSSDRFVSISRSCGSSYRSMAPFTFTFIISPFIISPFTWRLSSSSLSVHSLAGMSSSPSSSPSVSMSSSHTWESGL